MRRVLSILLVALFSLPLISPLLALGRADAAANLPACCRRAGAHHCQMHLEEREAAESAGARVSAPVERCPYSPRGVIQAHAQGMMPGVSARVYAGLVSHPAGTAQTESKWRMARDRSRQKRGPPSRIG